MRRILLISLLITLTCGCAPPPIIQRVQYRLPDDGPRPVTSVYRVNAKVEPDSLWLRAQVEIDFQNLTFDTLTVLTIVQEAKSRKPSTHADRSRMEILELDGKPVKLSNGYSNSEFVLVPLHSPLVSGERVAISFTLTNQLPLQMHDINNRHASIQFVNWLPRVYGDTSGLSAGIHAEPADFEVSISIDSGWLMVASGELLNEKELLGMLPNFDTIITDVIHHPYESDGYTFSRLPSAKGQDCYQWRARNNTDFDFMILHGYQLDRGMRGNSAVESYYPAEIAESWQYRVAEEGLKLLEYASQKHSGSLSSPLRIVASGNLRSWFADNIQVLPETMKRPKLLPIE